jgi:hypothetical protein
METVQIAVPISNISNQLTIKRYFDEKNMYIWYDIVYAINRHHSNKLSLCINIIEQEGFYPSNEEYFFDTILSIKKEYQENNEYSLSITFLTSSNLSQNISVYTYKRFSSEHADILHKFLIDNVFNN